MSNIISAWAALSLDERVRNQSSSGGLFHEFSRSVLEEKGVVYGVAMSHDNRVAEYYRVSDYNELDKLLGSKYLQAKMGDVFLDVKDDLENGAVVLFSGTGCTINGLKLFLGHEYENLYCVDVICHGTPSPLIWKKYIEYLEKENNSKLLSVNFRCKDNGWERFGVFFKYTHSHFSFSPASDDPYIQMFLRNLSLRPSCFECQAKTIRLSDITLGDFWGIDKVAPDMNDGKGTSLVILRTNKGRELFGKISGMITVKEVNYHDAIRENLAEYKSVPRTKEREMFFADSNSMSFEKLANKYIPLSFKKKVKKLLLQTPFKKIIK